MSIRDMLVTARAEALFASALPTGGQPHRSDLDLIIRETVRRYRGVRGCAEEMAAAFGQYPETAAPRMRWSRQVVVTAYAAWRT